MSDHEVEFTTFFEAAEPRLRLALSGAFGADLGRESAADALAWAWQNWERLSAMDNPVGYLSRVWRSRALRQLRPRGDGSVDGLAASWEMPDFEPRLGEFLAELSESQRVSGWMVHGLGFPQTEVADLLGCSASSVATHVRRALDRLRDGLEVDSDV